MQKYLILHHKPDEKPPGGTRPREIWLTVEDTVEASVATVWTVSTVLVCCSVIWWDFIGSLDSCMLKFVPSIIDDAFLRLNFFSWATSGCAESPRTSVLLPPGGLKTRLELRSLVFPEKIFVEVILQSINEAKNCTPNLWFYLVVAHWNRLVSTSYTKTIATV